MKKLIKTIGSIADDNGYEAYVVGGYVRDVLLNRDAKDFDVMVVGDGIEFANIVSKTLNRSPAVAFKKFGTAMLPMDDIKVEFVGARSEQYSEDSRKPDVQQADLRSDLSRRDFTINALAMSINAASFGNITDVFDGRKDLENKILRTPLDPEKTFDDDPLRIMRCVRFATQLDFTIEKKTSQAMAAKHQRLQIVSQERITDEFLKILSSARPSTGIWHLYHCGALKIFFPEFVELYGTEVIQGHNHKDVFKHTLKVVDNIAEKTDDVRLRFAALTHDIAKPRVKRFVEGIGWTFYGHDRIGARMVARICRRMKLPNDFQKYASHLVDLHMRPMNLVDDTVTDSAIRRLIFQARDNIDDLITLCRSDITSSDRKKVKKYLANFDYVVSRIKEVEERDRIRAFQSPVRGDEIMKICGLKPGPAVGRLKNMIEEAILDGIIPNEHEAALQYLMDHKDQILSEVGPDKQKIPNSG